MGDTEDVYCDNCDELIEDCECDENLDEDEDDDEEE
jgi:hypothetical protein